MEAYTRQYYLDPASMGESIKTSKDINNGFLGAHGYPCK